MTKEDYFDLGMAYIGKKEWEEALKVLQESQKQYPDPSTESLPPQLLSALGLCFAMSENNVQTGLELCEHAVEREPFWPEFYYHLGIIYLKEGGKQNAVWWFYHGLKVDPHHPGINAKMRQLGIRKKRSIHFLPRKNFMNKFIGQWVF